MDARGVGFRRLIAGSRRLVIFGASVLIAAAVASCGGSDAPAYNPYLTGTQALPNVPTTKITSRVVLPSGSTVGATQLTVLSMVDQAVPEGNGQFSLASSDNGSQIAVVLSPRGTPMLLGWLDANHANISASTTAEVLVYFGLGGYLIDAPANRETLIKAIPSATGFAALVSSIGAALAADPDTFAASNAAVAASLTAVVGPLLAGASTTSAVDPATEQALDTRSLTTSRLHQLVSPHAVQTQGGIQSGLEVQADDPSSAHVVNNTRRRAWAFVNGVSSTTDGITSAYSNALTNFEVAPEVGLNNGFAGTLSDLINYAYGNTTAAYAPVTAPDSPFAMTQVPDSSATTYQVTIVGPGNGAIAALTSLPSNEAKQLAATAVKGYLVDAFLPFIVNVVAGVNSANSGDLTGSNPEFYKNLFVNVATDFTSLLDNAPGLYDKILGGDQIGALNDFMTSVSNSNAYQQIIEDVAIGIVKNLETSPLGSTVLVGSSTGIMTALSKFNRIIAAAGVTLQVFDSVVWEATIENSNAVENWTVTATSSPVKISPLTSTINVSGTVPLTATLPGVTDLSPYSFLWSTTGLAGTLTGANASQRGVTSYCSSSPTTTYQASATPPFQSGQNFLQDTVWVQVYQGTGASACTTAPLIAASSTDATNGNSPPATVVVDKNAVSITPENPTVPPGQTVAFTADAGYVSTDGSQPIYHWSLQGNGSLSADTGATISYTAGASGPDTLTVAASTPQGMSLGTGSDTITVQQPSGLTLTASSGSACCGGLAPGTYTTSVVPVGSYTDFCANYECGQQYGLVVGWPGIATLDLGLATGATITGPGSWGTYTSILNTIVAGQFLFISPTSDNQGQVNITKVTPLPNGQLLAIFDFTESSSSGSSTRTYNGGGSFIIPAPPASPTSSATSPSTNTVVKTRSGIHHEI